MAIQYDDALPAVATATILRERSLELLEFPRIREALAAHAQLPISREMALGLEPAYDAETVAHRQRETAEARLLLDQSADAGLSMERDVRALLDRVAKGGYLTGGELLAVADALEMVRHAKTVGTRRQGQTPLLHAVARHITDLRSLEREVRRIVSPSGELNDDATPYLRQLRQESRTAYRRATQSLERFIDSDMAREVLQERLITVRSERLVVPVKADFRGRFPGIVHDVSDSGATLFIEPVSNVRLCNAWRESSAAEQDEANHVLRRLSAAVAKRVGDIAHALELAGHIDLAFAKARYAQACHGEPVQAVAGGIGLSDARHPLLPGGVVPISLVLDGPVTGLVITGPNMGGKTVALKVLGLLVLMHQAGLQVPAGPATRLPIVDGVYADIGDQQSIQLSVSTFSSHISAITGVLAAATPRSLVLLDELGSSTDPEEGSALARAILAHLVERHVPTVVTTHHRAVAAFAEEHPALENASVELDRVTLRPTYRVTMGLPGRSYAMAVAERLGLDARVLSVANGLQDPAYRAAESMLAGLQEERYHTRRRLQQAEEASAHAEELRRELERQLEEVALARDRVVEETRQELQAQAREIMAKLKQAQVAAAWEPRLGAGEPPPPRVTDEARREVEDVQRRLRSRIWGQQAKAAPRRRGLSVGDQVEVGSMGFTGMITSLPDRDEKRVEVLVGSARVRLDASRLRKVGSAPQAAPPGITSLKLDPEHPVLTANPELDLRGMRLHESLERLDAFLDDALTQECRQVRIIHGKGTGVLRQGVWKHLANHSAVQGYDFAGPRQGGDGATVVELG
jgi:DNA mismatch repair protein MutS2